MHGLLLNRRLCKAAPLFYTILFLSLIFTFAFAFVSCGGTPVPSQTRAVLGTVCTVQLFEKGKPKYYDALFNRLSEIEEHMSVNIPSSDIARINAAAGIETVEVHTDTFEVIKAAFEFAALTDGAFNPAGGALVQLWKIGSDSPHLPSREEIDGILTLCDWHSVVLTEGGKQSSGVLVKPSAFLTQKGSALDLGGIAKGYAADEMARMIRGFGIKGAIVDLGGNIYAVGEKTGGNAWKVGIKNPFDSTGAPVLAVSLKDCSVVTSGVYERFFEKDGRRYHHLLDYTTGYPADNGLMSVTIIHDSSMTADALATAVFIMGKDKGMDFLRKQNIPGLCIDRNKEIGIAGIFDRSLTVLNTDFKIN